MNEATQESKQEPANNDQPDQKSKTCRHIFTAGHRCGSYALRGEPFCYYHHDRRDPIARQTLKSRRARSSSFEFELPDPTDRLAIQLSIVEVLQRVASNSLDTRRAGILLYGLQTIFHA